MNLETSHAAMFQLYLSSLISNNHIQIDVRDTRVVLLKGTANDQFLCGRDINQQPFIGVQSSMLPWFTQVPWHSVHVDRKRGLVFLEARDTETGIPLFAFGLRTRPRRVDVFCVDQLENPSEKRVSIVSIDANTKAFTQTRIKNMPLRIITSHLDIFDQHNSPSVMDSISAEEEVMFLDIEGGIL
jgi:hypothetical protein